MIGGSSRQIFEAVLVGWLHALRTGRRALVLTMDASLVSKDLAEIRALVARGALRAVIDRVMPMSAAADAVRVLESGHVRGKLVLDAAALIDAA
jgi:NADPH:quinone reductase-like Zn-dependent oxidoreductase